MEGARSTKVIAVALIALVLVVLLYLFATVRSPVDTEPLLAHSTTDMITTPEGIIIETLQEGSGEAVKKGQIAHVRYVGTLTDGKVFDQNTDGSPFSFKLGAGQVIQGWDIGVEGMKIGERRRLTIPSAFAYGKSGYPGVIPPDATLIFTVDLVSID